MSGEREPSLLIAGGTVVTPEGPVSGELVVRGGRVAMVPGSPEPLPDPGDEVLDASGLIVAPGFIDLQINGGFGYDFASDPGSIWEVGARLPATGVSAFLPTIVTSIPAVVAEATAVLGAGPPPGYAGAVPLGLHLEGPMISPARAGAHDPTLITGADVTTARRWVQSGQVRMVTLAPELDGIGPVIEMLARAGVVVSLGHSDADFDHAVRALDLGATAGTHLFNAMRGLGHRDPAMVGALLGDPRVTVGLIADGRHVHPAVVSLVLALKDPEGLALVTDAIAAMGAPPGTYRLGSVTVHHDGVVPRTAEGALAGSVLTLDRAVRNLVGFTGCGFVDALATVTSTPASLLGELGRGGLFPGARADLVLLDDSLEVRATVIGGELVHGVLPVSSTATAVSEGSPT